MIIKVLGPHIVQDHVYAGGGYFSYLGRPIIVVGDRVIGTNGSAEAQLVLTACSRDHRRTDALRVLDGERTDATSAAMYQKPVTISKADELDIRVDGCCDLDHSRRCDQLHPKRWSHNLTCRGCDVLRVAAASQERDAR